jgi:hypothetical protein
MDCEGRLFPIKDGEYRGGDLKRCLNKAPRSARRGMLLITAAPRINELKAPSNA